MNSLVCIIGMVAAFIVLFAGFEYIFNPAGAKQLIKTAATRVAILLGCFIAALELLRAHPVGVLLAMCTISPAAYLIRERRLHRPERPLKLGALERTPVAPREMRGGD